MIECAMCEQAFSVKGYVFGEGGFRMCQQILSPPGYRDSKAVLSFCPRQRLQLPCLRRDQTASDNMFCETFDICTTNW